jgi:Tol biopolymer transport system component
MRPLLVAAMTMATALSSSSSLAAPAPHLHWRTIKTPCCDVHYPEAQHEVGERVAAIVDECADHALELVRGRLQDRIQVVLHNVTDSPNGFANIVPYNRVELRAITPEDDSELAKNDDWLRLLVQHEFMHIAHLDVVHGLPAVVNVMLGKVWPPNSVQPRLFIEGLAVFAETRFTGAGRLRSSLFKAPLRIAALQGDRWTLDDASNVSRRPPGGSAAYVYGAFFVEWLTKRYGTQLWAAYAHDYGGSAVPFAVQRSLESITGRDLALDWEDFLDDVERDARVQAAQSLARGGPTPSRRLTRFGGVIRRPAFLADGTMIVGASPPDGPSGIYAIRDLPDGVPDPEPIVRTTDAADLTVVDDDIVFTQSETHQGWFGFRDVFVRSANGVVRQVTFGQRLKNPVRLPSDEGRVIVAEQRTGTRAAIVTVNIDTGVINDVVVAEDGVTLYAPRPSPDGTRLVVSRLDSRGRRRVAIFQIAERRWQELSDTDGLVGDQLDPSFIDDDSIAYADDRDGVFHLFVVDLRTGQRRRIVDTLGSAALPVVTPDGHAVVYTDAHLDGVDLQVASLIGVGRPVETLAPSSLVDVDVTPVGGTREGMTDAAMTGPVVSEPYSPWASLWPRTWSPELSIDPILGVAVGLGLDGSDAAQLVSWTLRGGMDSYSFKPNVQGTVRLTNLTLPLSVTAELRPVLSDSVRQNDGAPELHIEDQLRATASMTVPLRRRRFAHSLTFGTQRAVAINETGVTSAPDSLAPRYPASVRSPVTQAFTLDWFYSHTEQYRDSVSTERGVAASVRLRLADRTILSDVEIREFIVDFRAFQPVPGLSNHVMAAYLNGGAALDDRPGSRFFMGGFVNRSVLQDAFSGQRSGGGVLRGFPVAHVVGDALASGTLEYRFPLLEVEQGVETLPAFIDRINGCVFVDTATAFDARPGTLSWATGVGAEVRLQLILGYYGSFQVRMGYARGLTPGGVDQPYTVLGFGY